MADDGKKKGFGASLAKGFGMAKQFTMQKMGKAQATTGEHKPRTHTMHAHAHMDTYAKSYILHNVVLHARSHLGLSTHARACIDRRCSCLLCA